jgi:DNA-binding CsgD family transcriptional regulator
VKGAPTFIGDYIMAGRGRLNLSASATDSLAMGILIDSSAPRACGLTRREVEVLHLIAHGCTYREVARRLGVSAHTVGSHIKNAYRKLDVHSAAAAVMRAVELRLFGILPTQPSPASDQ